MTQSVNLYDTFGNEVKYNISQNTLTTYIENSTINFPLPEASSVILSELAPVEHVNSQELELVQTRLESIGFSKPNARAMASILIQVASVEGVSPLDYFENNEASLKLAIDTYATINLMRPAGNRIGLRTPIVNSKTRFNSLIKP